MKKVIKEIFVSEDGNEFETEKECSDWEKRAFLKNPVNLTDEEIIGLLKLIFYWIIDDPDTQNSVRIEIQGEDQDGTGFQFKITYQSKGENSSKIEGVITGDNDIEVTECQILMDCGFSIKKTYQYLESIGFFKEGSITPVENPNIKEEWVIISEYEQRSK